MRELNRVLALIGNKMKFSKFSNFNSKVNLNSKEMSIIVDSLGKNTFLLFRIEIKFLMGTL